MPIILQRFLISTMMAVLLFCSLPGRVTALPFLASSGHTVVQNYFSGDQPILPQTVVLLGQLLGAAKTKLQGGDADLQQDLDNLVKQAKKYLKKGPWSVTNNQMSVPNGTIHDYASQAPYYWPNNWETPESGEVCPYVKRDGYVNPEASLYTSKQDRADMFTASYSLALAWYYTDTPAYREHAAQVIKAWFLDEDTAMTPHLKHSQIIPCENDGRAIGILDFSEQYTTVLDAAAILSTVYDASWNSETEKAFKAWNQEFLTWLTDSEFGKKELAATNNHGTFARQQIAGIAAYVGQNDLAAAMAQGAKAIVDSQIESDGSQPLELSRTRSWHYSCFNLVAHARLADIAHQVGVDLWGYKGEQGQSILGAIDYLIPYASTDGETWPYKELSFIGYGASDLVNAAADQGDEMAKAALPSLTYPSTGNQWPLRPSVEKLDKSG
ncbi:hypothetical protein L202_05124 [Cryptococcus amylolentus CBS 6039]|uniref:Alginate lyase domain-containing protein n=1 Tax=Cryptococcus amylolentus CBS 6039 TaxID=1295533 RepID=A0A1E3HRG7_9TREE|nr:hypothetical protein L202_05124 [Cryptococcus amylolentus CBS 6039]ODN78041.1 hypothetical protein L202_05124 [Cryptococcus amylolentus CBS 6039]